MTLIGLVVPAKAQEISCESKSFPYKWYRLGTINSKQNRDLGPVSSLAISPDSRTLVIGTRSKYDLKSNIHERLQQKQLIVVPVVEIESQDNL